ncbi:MAG TPA: sugar transporter, partial [Vicinamibacteria bacterium]
RRPGFVPFVPGADAAYYIAQAGGQGPAATDVYVREAGTGYLRAPGAGPIRSGDYVFIDRDVIADTEALQALALQQAQLDLQRDQEARTSRYQFIQTGLAVVSAVVGVVTTYLLITRESGN